MSASILNLNPKYLNVNIPKLATKQLAIQECKAGKKLVVSTNWLVLFGFSKGALVKEELLPNGRGMKVRLATKEDKKVKMVYSREYTKRKNNPLMETLLDIRSQKILNQAFKDAKMVHITFEYGEITITPMSDRKSEVIKKFKHSKESFNTFLACSSGVDAVSLKNTGFKINTCLEYRPNEARDKQDLTETGALNVLANVEVDHLINEDIMNLDIDKIARLTSKSYHSIFHISLQCDDFTNCKADSLKKESLENGTTTVDMFIDAINLIDRFKFPTVLIENVWPFFSNAAGDILIARLKRFGYTVYCNKYDAKEYGSLSNRVRGYLFATLLDAPFKEPRKTEINKTLLWDKYIEPKIIAGELRDVTETKSLKAGVKTGRARLITRDSTQSHAWLKSQNRQAKDSNYIYDSMRDRYYFPSNELMAELMGINVNCECVSKTIESEIYGQSISPELHEAILQSVYTHLQNAKSNLTGRLF